jgi:hypothetical protein
MISRNFLPLIVATFTLQGCTSTSGLRPEFDAPRVIERFGNSTKTPDWVNSDNPLYIEKNDVVYVNAMTMSGDARPEACNNAAGNVGRSQILRQIKENMTVSGQISEISSSSDPAVESLLAFLSQGTLSGVKMMGRYWERREESDASGQRVLRLHCSAKIGIARQLLEQQMLKAMGDSGSGNSEIRRRLLDAQKSFLDSIAEPSLRTSSPVVVDVAAEPQNSLE